MLEDLNADVKRSVRLGENRTVQAAGQVTIKVMVNDGK